MGEVKFLAAAIWLCAVMLPSQANVFHEYCVIGAGPAGLQMGYFLQDKKRDYIIFEKGAGAGTFYEKYPIHRTLISINKRHTGKTNKEFNFRHDWNSLISDDESLRMTNYSKELFPPADTLVQYLNDFASKLGLNVQYNTEVGNIMKQEDGLFNMTDPQQNVYSCQYVIVATGIAKPNKPRFPGSHHVKGYEDVTLNLDDYEGKSVLILGHGNAAAEVAQHIMPVTNYVHMLSRSRVKMAWATHYVGDLRAINDGLLDTYQLKSLDGIVEGSVEKLSIVKSKLDGRYYAGHESEPDSSPGADSLPIYDNDGLREGYDLIIGCLGFTFDDSIFNRRSIHLRRGGGKRKKYPLIHFTYEAANVKNLFFAGANTHSLDFRKSAGAFIHGYRYTTRTLHRILEWKNHGVRWPSVHFENLIDLLPHLMKRINEGSDIYQMFGVLCDVVIYNQDLTEATYLEAFPCPLGSKLSQISGHEVPGAVMFVVLEYGKNFSGPGKDTFFSDRAVGEAIEAHRSNFLHPVLYHYTEIFTVSEYLKRPEKWVLPVPKRIHHVVEDFTTKFDAHSTHILAVRRFLEFNTGTDLRNFFAKQCLILALSSTTLPLACQQKPKHLPSSNLVEGSEEMGDVLKTLSYQYLPYRIYV